MNSFNQETRASKTYSPVQIFFAKRIERIHTSYIRLNPWAVGGTVDRSLSGYLARRVGIRTSHWAGKFQTIR